MTIMTLTVFSHMSVSSMSHVNFKKWPSRPVELKGQGPHGYYVVISQFNFLVYYEYNYEAMSCYSANIMSLWQNTTF